MGQVGEAGLAQQGTPAAGAGRGHLLQADDVRSRRLHQRRLLGQPLDPPGEVPAQQRDAHTALGTHSRLLEALRRLVDGDPGLLEIVGASDNCKQRGRHAGVPQLVGR